MSRPRNTEGRPITVTFTVAPSLADSFRNLCKDLGIRRVEALKRLMIQAVNTRQIPGLLEVTLGSLPVPVYDGPPRIDKVSKV